jgi:spore coat polysaccharide biosynthesis protein SpsF
MKTIIIIQARMGSTRLPGKVLMPLGEAVVLEYVVQRSRQVREASHVIVATTTSPADDAVERWCREREVEVFRGSEDDVLGRYLACAEPYRPDLIIRGLADCPFFHYELASEMIRAAARQSCDVFRLDEPAPLGLGVDFISYEALRYIGKHGQEAAYREHVTFYAHERISEFRSAVLPLPDYCRNFRGRLTLDTEEDYQLMCRVADWFAPEITVPTERIVTLLREHPEWLDINAHVVQKRPRG